MPTLEFSKYHAAGNDFIIIDAREIEPPGAQALARRLCERRTGIGADGLLLATAADSPKERFSMRVINADGGEAEVSGNGLRCLALWAVDRGIAKPGASFDIRTAVGPRSARVDPEGVTVAMAVPVFPAGGATEIITLDGRELRFLRVSVGNPHAVIFVEDVSSAPVAEWGPALEQDRGRFPEGTNVGFAAPKRKDALDLRVWERGVGETPACGSGAVAALAAAALTGRTDRAAAVRMAGGELHVAWREDGVLWLTGPAEKVFEGRIEV